MSIIVSIALATICFMNNGIQECHPVLLGKSTPTPIGEYQLIRRFTEQPGYGGDVLQFKESGNMVFAIHRIWLLSPNQQREKRIRSEHIPNRFITNGCINVEIEVYDKLVDCCSNDTIIIK